MPHRNRPQGHLQHGAGDDPIRVCHAVASAEGGSWHLEQLVRLRTQHGHETVSLLPSIEGSLERRLAVAGIPCVKFDFDFPGLPPFPDLVDRVVRLAALFRRERFDVVQTVLWHSMLLGRLAAWLADVPVRVHMAAGIFHQEAPITEWIDRDTCWMETALIGGCRYLHDIYGAFGVSEQRRKIVYFGPDENRFRADLTEVHDLRRELGWPASTPVIVQVAWFYARVPDNRWSPPSVAGNAVKGQEDLIRATPSILRRHPDAKVVFIGSGWLEGGQAYMAEMQALVEELRLSDSVIFLGARSDVAELLKGADVAVQPSRNECCGGTLEALLMECPTVATRVGGMPEIVIDGETGVVVDPAAPEDLARGICSLLDDVERGRALGRAGRAHVLEVATLAKTASGLDAIYREFLFKGGRRRRGYRLWLSFLRLPVVVLVSAYLCWRLHRVENHYLPKWQTGWRPWHLQAVLSLPRAIWNHSIIFRLRHDAHCAALRLRGHCIGLRHRTIFHYGVISGTMRGHLRCWPSRIRGHAISLRQRTHAKLHFAAGTIRSYPLQSLCWWYRVRGKAGGLYQRSVCRAYIIRGTLRSCAQRLLSWSYRVRGQGKALLQQAISRAHLVAGVLRRIRLREAETAATRPLRGPAEASKPAPNRR